MNVQSSFNDINHSSDADAEVRREHLSHHVESNRVLDTDEPDDTGRILVLGLGNTLLGDDGLGVHVVNRLRGESDDRTLDFVDGGTLGFRLASLVANHPACIIVDAAELHLSPGTIKILKIADLLGWFLTRQRTSVHEAGLIDLLTLLHLEDKLPDRLAIVAIQPAKIEWYERLSESAYAALPHACETVLDVAQQWR